MADTVAVVRKSRVAFGLSFGTVCWLVLWAGINTGPGALRGDYMQSGLFPFFQGVRALFSLSILVIGILHLLVARSRSLRRFTAPEMLWIYYALVCLASSTYADPWFDVAYWGFAYLAVFAASKIFMQEGPDPLERAIELNRLNWLVASMILVIMLVAARGELFVHSPMGLTAYGLIRKS